ncbi:MAG: alanyl-tRNA editing protein, partial [Chloroflexi bacterium]|nr:alanyl-tRNA editing protein [Chloroflexota bacterium]
PFDQGTINGSQVVDVVVRPADGAIVHVLAGEVSGEEARGEVDWARRFDHMQQHTGQHILSQAFVREANAETVSFHLGADLATIDLAASSLSAEALERAEELANRVVMENVPVKAWFPSEDELAKIALRKTPEGLEPGALRVVAIGDFDFNACGGTHVACTGEIGTIKIIKTETFRRNVSGQLRVEFRCGRRALDDYRQKNAIVNQLAADFTCGFWEVDQAVARLRAEAQTNRRELKTARDQLLDYEAASLAASASSLDGLRVIRKAWPERDAAELRALAGKLAAQANSVALLGTAGEKARLVLARAEGLAPDMNVILKSALAALGSGRGGGSPSLAQGGGAAANLDQVESALSQAEKELLSRL